MSQAGWHGMSKYKIKGCVMRSGGLVRGAPVCSPAALRPNERRYVPVPNAKLDRSNDD